MKNSIRILITSLILTVLFFSLYKGLSYLLFEQRLLGMRKNHFLGLARAVQSAPDFSTAASNIQLNYDQIVGTETIFWIIRDSGEILFSSSGKPLENEIIQSQITNLKTLNSNEILETRFEKSFKSSIFVFVKLPDEPNQILVVQSARSGFVSKINSWVFIIILLSSVGVWVIANVFLYFYIRNKNRAIEQILNNIEKGNLGQRLRRNWFDGLLGLFRDFNLMSEKLEKTFTKIQQIELEKNQLIQELTHDLRTPLTSLKAASEALMDSAIHADTRSTLLKVILDETDYLNQLIEDLFFLSDIPSATRRHSPFSIQEILKDEIARYDTLKTQINFEIKQSATNLKIDNNEILFRRLISNLVKNSVQVGAKNLRVLCEKDSDRLKLIFIDDGPGMSLEQIAHYGRKNKVRSFYKKDFKGSLGLGSVIIHRIVTALHGELVISNNTQGEGLSIQIVIPHV